MMIGQLRIMVNLERFNFNLTQPKKKNLLSLSLKLIDLRRPMGSLLLPLKIQLIQFWGVKNDRDYESLIAPIELVLLKTKPK